jgi:hypothetical protein
MSILEALKEVESLVREKHQAGRHSQADHTPKKYGKGGGAAGYVERMGAYQSLEHVDRIAGETLKGTAKVAAHDESTEEETRLRVEVTDIKDGDVAAQFAQDLEDWYDPIESEYSGEGDTRTIRMTL